ncbi:hypothetical protein GCM10023093_07900 [Nemorincola caseinilytica]|uniref:BIG2 domain-containing protein n=1 Tax=Nemorincola caseinilytica TaxID=2054315 RepID=A0ABP8N993_9BACT
MDLRRYMRVFLLLLCVAGMANSYGQGCDTATAPVFSKSCFTEYFTNIHATGDMGTTSTISVNATSCTGTYTDLSATQGIDAPVGAKVYLHISRYTTHYTGYVSVYIDWNRDNIFGSTEYANWPANPTPDVELGPTVMDSVYEISLVCGAPAGRYHMRVMLSEARNNTDAPCIGTYGQAYDFYFNSYCPNNILVGDTLLCRNDTATLRASYGCGEWESSNSIYVSVDTNGVITSGTATGTAIITYSSIACGRSTVVVSVAPATIAMPTPLCIGGIATATSWPAGGSWSIGSSYVAIISASGATCDVTGVHAGSTALTYTFGDCSASMPMNIYSNVSVSGDAIVCPAGTKALSVVPPGGTWSSNNTSIATIGTGGVVTGVIPGTVIITYTAPYGGCMGYKIMTVEDVITPYEVDVCAGATTTLTATPSGGTWALHFTASGMTHSSDGVLSGIYTYRDGSMATYTTPAGCQGTTLVNVNSARIHLPDAICIGSSIQVWISFNPELPPSPVSGVMLSSSDPSVATANGSTGYVTGVATGTAIITYTMTPGCIATKTVAVGTTPLMPTMNLCMGNILDFSIDGDGTWTSSDIAVVDVELNDGLVTTVGTGTANITFTPASYFGAGCPVVHQIAVLESPIVSGTSTVCQGSTITLTGSPSGGTWYSSNLQASVSGGGVVAGMAAGTPTIVYVASNGCEATKVVTVYGMPAISGASSVCAPTTLSSNMSGGTWSSGNIGLATVTSGGIVTSLAYGSVLISYTSMQGCVGTYSITSLKPQITNSNDNYCITGTGYSLTGSPTGGVWTSSDPSLLSISPSGDITIRDNDPGGSVVLMYDLGSCPVSKTVTVRNRPELITVSGLPVVYLSSHVIYGVAMNYSPWASSAPWGPSYGFSQEPVATPRVNIYSNFTGDLTVAPASVGKGYFCIFIQLEGKLCYSKKVKVFVLY